jgi:hypothetical protein
MPMQQWQQWACQATSQLQHFLEELEEVLDHHHQVHQIEAQEIVVGVDEEGDEVLVLSRLLIAEDNHPMLRVVRLR